MSKTDVWSIFQGLSLFLLAPGMLGLVAYVKARLQGRGRRFTTILQPYRDLRKLFHKTAVRTETASWYFSIAPVLIFAIASLLAFTTPVVQQATWIAADLVTLIYLMGASRFLLSLAGLDSGSPFGSLGSSREMFFHFITEICLFMILAALALQWNTVDLGALRERVTDAWLVNVVRPQFLLLGVAFFIVILLENGRIPIDNPSTHLELTMSSRAIMLEYAGPDLALIEWAEMVKFGVLLTLFINIFFPVPLFSRLDIVNSSTWPMLLVAIDYLFKLFLLLLFLSFWELHRPKLRLGHAIRPGLMAIVLSLTAIIYIVATQFGEGI